MFENYLQRKLSGIQHSEPIIVEGSSYRMNICPNGEAAGEGTHISIYVNRTYLPALELDQDTTVSYRIKMLNSQGKGSAKLQTAKRDFERKKTSNWGWTKFYLQSNLLDDGFIFPDGSLRFEFAIKKNNQRQQLQIA